MIWSKKHKLIAVIFCLISSPLFLNAQLNIESKDTDINLTVEGCNNNLVCEVALGETLLSCPADCTYVPPAVVEEKKDDARKSRSGGRIIPISEIFTEFGIQNIDYQNPSNIKIVVEGKNVSLYWNNPEREDFGFIRIMKNDVYSNDPYSGSILYEGALESFKDNINYLDKDYFYNFFAKYKDGYFSPGITFVVNSKTPSVFEDIKTGIENSTDIKVPDEELFEKIFFTSKMNIYDFSFTQDSKKLIWKDDYLIANSDNPISVHLPKKEFFGPIQDIFFEADFYDKEGVYLRKEILKMDYVQGQAFYSLILDNISYGDKINFKVFFTDESGEKYLVSGGIKVKDFAYEEPLVKDDKAFILIVILILLFILFKKKFSNKK